MLNFIFKTLISGIIWVFILSIPYQGKPVFDHLNELLVENQVVAKAGAQTSELLQLIRQKLLIALDEGSEEIKRQL